MLISALPASPPQIRVEVPVEVPKPVVPDRVAQKVKEKSGFLSWLTGLFGSGALGLGWLAGMTGRPFCGRRRPHRLHPDLALAALPDRRGGAPDQGGGC
ncbi:hypothetical protein [Mesorhizobium sp. LSHC426A00]